MEPPVSPVLFSVLLFVGMLILLEIGRRIGVRRRPKESEGERGSLGTVEGAVFALFGLMMAFTFSGAATRFNEKRMLIAEEANTIETAYLRLELSPAGGGQTSRLIPAIRGLATRNLSEIAEYDGGPTRNGQFQENSGGDLDGSGSRYSGQRCSPCRRLALAACTEQYD